MFPRCIGKGRGGKSHLAVVEHFLERIDGPLTSNITRDFAVFQRILVTATVTDPPLKLSNE